MIRSRYMDEWVGLVVVAFTFIPWLHRPGEAPAAGVGLGAQLRAGAEGLEEDVIDEVGKVESEGLGALVPRAKDEPPAAPASGPGPRRRGRP